MHRPSPAAASRVFISVALVLCMIGASSVGAQPATTRAAAPAGALRATITAIQGSAQVRESEAAPWKPARVGMVVETGAEFRTGPRSTLTFSIPPDQTCTIDRLTTIKLLQAIGDGRKLTTDLGMQYGRTMYEIEAAGIEHDSRIVSPGATMAVRGTRIIYDDHAPFAPSLVSNEGRVQYRNLRRQMVAFGGRQRAKMNATDRAPSETARKETRLNPQGAFAARSESENERIESNTSVAGLDANGILAISQLRAVFGPGTIVAVPEVPGPLRFDLFWEPLGKGTPSAADVDLLITDPKGRVASFSNPQIGSGTATGNHSGNDRGKAGVGTEFVEWGKFFPQGTYRIEARHAGGAQTQVTLLRAQRSNKDVANFASRAKPITLSAGQSVTRTVRVK